MQSLGALIHQFLNLEVSPAFAPRHIPYSRLSHLLMVGDFQSLAIEDV